MSFKPKNSFGSHEISWKIWDNLASDKEQSIVLSDDFSTVLDRTEGFFVSQMTYD